jgi:Icc-related predicted phosphoesterase
MGRTIVIGDIHGCFDELTDLLNLVKLQRDDRVVAVGDLIVRGKRIVKSSVFSSTMTAFLP